MASVLLTIGSTVMIALGLISTNFSFSKLMNHSENEPRSHNLALDKLQRAINEQSEDRMKQLDFISKRLRQKNNA